jgi:hypothetical protein
MTFSKLCQEALQDVNEKLGIHLEKRKVDLQSLLSAWQIEYKK